eukprot:2887851-Rhodomonas_salina.1
MPLAPSAPQPRASFLRTPCAIPPCVRCWPYSLSVRRATCDWYWHAGEYDVLPALIDGTVLRQY